MRPHGVFSFPCGNILNPNEDTGEKYPDPTTHVIDAFSSAACRIGQ